MGGDDSFAESPEKEFEAKHSARIRILNTAVGRTIRFACNGNTDVIKKLLDGDFAQLNKEYRPLDKIGDDQRLQDLLPRLFMTALDLKLMKLTQEADPAVLPLDEFELYDIYGKKGFTPMGIDELTDLLQELRS